MKWQMCKKSAWVAFLLSLLVTLAAMNRAGDSPIVISYTGSAGCSHQVHVDVNPNVSVGVNSLSLGFQLNYGSLGAFQQYPELRQLASDADFKLVRISDILRSEWIPTMMPCTQFQEASGTGTYDWTVVDDIVGKILDIQAEPLVCLGDFRNGTALIPPGMAIDPETNLPNPKSYAAYSVEWVKHFKAKGWNIKYYEIFNEPWAYFGWDPVNFTRLNDYMAVFGAAATSMRQVSPNLTISFDFICRKPVMDYWLTHGGADVDSLNFHKYDAWVVGQDTNAEMFARADSEYFGTWPLGQSIVEARQTWFDARGKSLPLICSESNFNAAFVNGTDLKIQQMAGAVWLAMVLRNEMLSGVSYNIYFELSDNYYKDSYGFGMINYMGENGFAPWYPYYVQQMFGNNLAPDDTLVETTCSSECLKTIGWVHNGMLNVLLICMVNQSLTVNVQGFQNQQLNTFKIDDTIPWESAKVQHGVIDSTEPLVLSGHTVALLQALVPPYEKGLNSYGS
jgi:hypothetical protein